MSTIAPGELYEVAGAADPETIMSANLAILTRWLFEFEPSYQNGAATTLNSAPTSGAHTVDELWRDAIGGLWVCTAGGSPGTWKQLLPAVVDARPTVATGYQIIRRDDGWRREYYDGAAWQVVGLDLIHNLAASAAPAVGDDDADGYLPGSLWVDTTADRAYVCLDASTGAAVWVEVTNLVSAVASQGEAEAGTATDRAMTPERTQQAINYDARPLILIVGDESTALTTGVAKLTFRMPFAATLVAVRASVTTAPTDADLIVDINEAGSTVLSGKLTIDAGAKTSVGSASPAVISDSALADDAEITIDIDQIGSTVAGAGLKVTLFVRKA